MNKEVVPQFLVYTFGIMILGWGLCLVCGLNGVTTSNHFWLYIPFMLGGLSPTIASYIVLKKNNEVTGFKGWLKNIFTVKKPVFLYLLVIVLGAIYFIPQIYISGLEKMEPVYMFFLLLPVMIIGGGMEEAGWRYILQPEWEKRYGYVLSSVMVAVIWALWHLPLFFIPGASQYGTNFGFFAISVFGLTFALGAIHKISNSVFLCVLFHCIVNAGFSVFIYSPTFWGTVAAAGLLIMVSAIGVFIYRRKTT